MRGAHPDIVCLSHLRWSFVFQRPQQLMSRLAGRQRVFFAEEPIVHDGPPQLDIQPSPEEVTLLVPRLRQSVMADPARAVMIQQQLLRDFMVRARMGDFVLWYYTPMALPLAAGWDPRLIVYDCMDELSQFAGAPPELREREAQLLRQADLVLTGGQSLYEAKRGKNGNVHLFPSSVDAEHFSQARTATLDPMDQQFIPRPRIGYAGVIDERMDLGLLAGVAAARPDWQLVMLGPVVKVDTASLPVLPNIHYLGMKSYSELPAYIGGWDVAMLPFARNDATRFISPTKTPEYLAAGRPVVSTSIRDVVRPYGVRGLVHVADTVEEFVAAIDAGLRTDLDRHREAADRFIARMSWDETVRRMQTLMDAALASKVQPSWNRAAERT
jgi:glycosyltransferase involved in cell wall biosynthesis